MRKNVSKLILIVMAGAILLLGFNNCGVIDVTKMRMSQDGSQQASPDGSTTVLNPGDPGGSGDAVGGPQALANVSNTFCKLDSLNGGSGTTNLCRNEMSLDIDMVRIVCLSCSSKTFAEIAAREAAGIKVTYDLEASEICNAKLASIAPGGSLPPVSGSSFVSYRYKYYAQGISECFRLILKDQ